MQKEFLSTIDLARMWGVSRATAYRRMVELEKQYGEHVVVRVGARGRRTRCRRSALEELSQGTMTLRVKQLEERIAALERRVLARG